MQIGSAQSEDSKVDASSSLEAVNDGLGGEKALRGWWRAKCDPSDGRMPLIDLTRLALAMSVMLSHTVWQIKMWPVPAPVWAVASFLAISGYFVLQSYERSEGWRHFAIKRVLRVMPAFVVALMIVFFSQGWHSVWLALRTYLTLGTAGPPSSNGVLWSLALEEVAYAVLAVLFTLGAYKAKWPIWIAFFVSCCVVYWAHSRTLHTPAIYANINVIPSFFAGNLIYVYREQMAKYWKVAPALTFLTLLHWDMHTAEFKMKNPILGLCLGVGLVWWFTNWRPKLPKLPDFSYSIYIYHLAWVDVITHRGLPFTREVFLVPLAVACIASWYLVESPALGLKKRLGMRSARRAAASVDIRIATPSEA